MDGAAAPVVGPWEGGHLLGCVQRKGNGWRVIITKKGKAVVRVAFSYSKYGGMELARAAAMKCHEEKSTELGRPNQYRICRNGQDTHAEVKLTRDKTTTIDVDDLHILEHRWWAYQAQYGGWYASAQIEGKSKGMHNYILNACYIDHIDGNSLNNRKSNLRISNPTENGRNRFINRNNKTGIPGVHYRETPGMWCTTWYENGKRRSRCFHVSIYGAEGARERAISARKAAEKKLGGYIHHSPEKLKEEMESKADVQL